jgi:hypothetical protein
MDSWAMAAAEAAEQTAVVAERVRYWGVTFAPVTVPVLCAGREVPVTMRILSDSDEEDLVRYMAALPLELPQMPAPQKGLEQVWQQDLLGRIAQLRAQAETRALLAKALVAIGDHPFDLPFEDKIKEIRTWPPRLLTGLLDAYQQVSRAPIVAREGLEREQATLAALEASADEAA